MPKITKKAKVKEVEKLDEAKQSPTVVYIADRDLLGKLASTDLVNISKSFNVKIDTKGERFTITSNEINDCRKAAIVLEKLFDAFDRNFDIQDSDIDELITSLLPKPLAGSKYRGLYKTWKGEEFSPRTENQELAIKMIKNKTISVLYGSSGSGKSFLANLLALKFLEDGRYDKIIIVRPLSTVGAGIGFLPGSELEKIQPYNSPVTEAFINILGDKNYEQYIKDKKIVFTPVSFTRGQNFSDAIIIIDEAQNLSKHEILTLLTRICQNTKVIITGDRSQSDIKSSKPEKSGLEWVVELLKDIDDVGMVKFGLQDIQRHKLVGEIIRAFE